MRRFLALPAALRLSAIGLAPPRPTARSCSGGTPARDQVLAHELGAAARDLLVDRRFALAVGVALDLDADRRVGAHHGRGVVEGGARAGGDAVAHEGEVDAAQGADKRGEVDGELVGAAS